MLQLPILTLAYYIFSLHGLLKVESNFVLRLLESIKLIYTCYKLSELFDKGGCFGGKKFVREKVSPCG